MNKIKSWLVKLGKYLMRFACFGGITWQDGTAPYKEMYSKAFQIAWPAMLEGMLLSVISSVDTYMVKSVHPHAIASINLTAQPRMILLIIAQALCVGTTALISRRKGENDRAGANSVLTQSILLVTGVGIAISLIGTFLAEPIMNLAGADNDTRTMSVAYFQIICSGLIFNCWNLCICAALRATGNTRITMITNITANLVNVVMNYCLIGGHFGFPAMGVRGAALATVIGTAVACSIAFVFVTRKNGYLRLKIRFNAFDKRTMSGLMKVGLSSMAESAALRIGFFINARLIAGINVDALTANTVVNQVTSLSFCTGDGIATAGATMVGQSLGAKRKDKAMGYVKTTIRMAMAVSIALMVLILFLRRPLAQIFVDKDYENALEVINGAALAFVVVIFGIIPQNARVVYSGCLRGAGDVKYVALCSLISVMLLRPLFTVVLCYVVNSHVPWMRLSYTGPWIAFVIDAYVRTWLLMRRINGGKFLDVKL